MANAACVRTLYTLLGSLITPGLRFWLEHRARRGKEDPFRISERFGYPSLPRPDGHIVWLHAASVGETQSVLTLVRALLNEHATLHVLITTGTVTSAALVAQQNLARVIHQFVPVDTRAAVRRFLQHWQPNLALWVESEFWPQMLWQAQAFRIPALLINARISHKTFNGWKRWPRSIRSVLSAFQTVYAGSTEDAARLMQLGATDVRDIGNLKFDAAALPIDQKLRDELLRHASGRPIVVAASTHPNEEQKIADSHLSIAQQFPSLLTIIVPRHAARGDAIALDLRGRGFSLAQRSKGESLSKDTSIYLADTMGELGTFYSIADAVFMGGSLIPHGGQNPLEPARAGAALVTGMYTHNFAAIIKQFVSRDAIVVVRDNADLAHALSTLLTNTDARKLMAARAKEVIEQSRGASTVILQHCALLLRGGAS